MDIRDYEYIVTIAEQGSITRAAAQLFITQSALTKYLQRVEKHLGLPLFIRNGNQFLLTEAGERYVETGRAVMHLDQQLSGELEKARTKYKSMIRLGYSMGRTSEMLEKIFPAFSSRYPDIRIYGRADTSRRQMMALHNGDLDFALVTNVERVPGYQYLPVGKSWLALAVRDDSPLLAESRPREGYPFPVIAPELLEGQKFVTLPVSTNSGKLAKELRSRYGIHVNETLELSDVRSLMDAIECGLGMAMFMSIPAGAKRIRYLSIDGAEAPEQMTELVFRSNQTLSEGMRYLISLITACQ